MATGAAEMMLRCVINAGSISRFDMEIKRRPYHRYCGCALHKLKGVCSNACSQQRNISFQKKHRTHGILSVPCQYLQLPNTLLNLPSSSTPHQ